MNLWEDKVGRACAPVKAPAGSVRTEAVSCGTVRPYLPGITAVIDLFGDWDRARAALDSAAADPSQLEPLAFTRRLAPLNPGKVLCAGANYYDHLKEMGVADTRKEAQRHSSAPWSRSAWR